MGNGDAAQAVGCLHIIAVHMHWYGLTAYNGLCTRWYRLTAYNGCAHMWYRPWNGRSQLFLQQYNSSSILAFHMAANVPILLHCSARQSHMSAMQVCACRKRKQRHLLSETFQHC